MLSFTNSRSNFPSKPVPISVVLLFLANGAEVRPDWRTEWESTLQAARKEERVVFYASTRYDGVVAEFQKKFPELKVTSVIAGATEHAQRIMAERRAGKQFADLYTGAVSVTYNILYKGKVFDP